MNRPPHIVGGGAVETFRLKPGSREAYAFSHLDFAAAARATASSAGSPTRDAREKLRAERKATLLLDGGDTWQGRRPRCGRGAGHDRGARSFSAWIS